VRLIGTGDRHLRPFSGTGSSNPHADTGDRALQRLVCRDARPKERYRRRTCSLPRVARSVVHRRRVQIVYGQEIVHLRVGGREPVREVTTLSLQVGVAVGHDNVVSTNLQTRIVPARGAVSAFQLLTFVGHVRRFDCQALGVAGGRENFHVDADLPRGNSGFSSDLGWFDGEDRAAVSRLCLVRTPERDDFWGRPQKCVRF